MKIQRLTAQLVCTAILLCAAVASAQTTANEVVLRATDAGIVTGSWTRAATTGASGGTALTQPNAGVAKIATPAANPQHYFELSFFAKAGVPYRLWIRAQAQGDTYTNDSVYVQFSGSVNASGAPVFRIATTDATVYSIEDCNGCGVSGWGWQDNGYGAGVLGPAIYFAADGKQTIRVQAREDGIAIDEIVLSPQKYLTAAPGKTKQDATVLPLSDGSAPVTGTVTLVRGPYLQTPGPSSMTVVWSTRESGSGEVRYGTTAASTTTAPATARLVTGVTSGLGFDYYQFEARLTGLTPATTYTYRPFVGGVSAAAAAAFKTAPATGTGDVTFIAFGDSGIGSVEQRQIATLIANEPANLVLHAGDIVYGTSATTGDATYTTYQSWFFDIYDWLPRLPFVPTEGNHDSRSTNVNGAAYRDLFVLPENGASPAFPDHAERYYSFDYGPIHFTVLDSEFAFLTTTRRAEQLSWLESDLAGTAQPWKIVLFHRPGYSSGTEHGSDLTIRAAFGPLFERYGVDLVITGHDHDFERTVPIRASTNPADRFVTYIVTGGGGAAIRPVTTNTWTAFIASRFHYTKTRVNGCTLTLQAIGTDGTVFDTSTISHCTAPPPPPPPPPPGAGEVVLYASSAAVKSGTWVVQADATAAGGQAMVSPDAGAAKLATPLAAPANYFELTFNAVAGTPYHLWVRGKAQNNYFGNDSIYVQFDKSALSTGTAAYRIGTTDAAAVSIEDCSGCGLAGWGWQDNAYGAFGPDIYFTTSGTQKIRVQVREDGLRIDQIVLSPATYLKASPGATKNDTVVLPPNGGG